MKEWTFIPRTVFAFIMFCGCARELEKNASIKCFDTFYVAIEEEATRVHLENGADVKWDIGDRIVVFSDLQEPVYFTREADGKFRGGEIYGNEFYAFPLYNLKGGNKGIQYNKESPSVLDCDMLYGFFDSDAATLPMVAKSYSNHLTFKQTGGILHFRLKSKNRLYGLSLEPLNKESINGQFSIELTEEFGVLQLDGVRYENMLADCPENEIDSGYWEVFFYLPPVCMSKGFCLDIHCLNRETGEEFRLNKISNKEIALSRGEMISFPLIDVDSDYEFQHDEVVHEREILQNLYQSTNGENWFNNFNWCSDLPVNSWYGIETDRKGFITSIKLNANHLSGEFPSDIWSLPCLKELRVNNNRLSIRIPKEEEGISSSIEVIDMGNYDLVMSSAGDQVVADKENVILEGIPNSIRKLDHLCEFYAHKTNLSGSIPEELWTSSLRVLWLQGNSLDGRLTPAIGNATALEDLSISENSILGSIPEELWLPSLRKVDLRKNCLEGELTSAIGNAHNLEYLSLSNNRLGGEIPEEICELSQLRTIDLSTATFFFDSSETWINTSCNHFTRLPSNIGKLKNLQQLILYGNALRGELPLSLFECTNLTRLELSSTDNYDDNYNDFNCALPNELGNLENLEYLSIFSAGINGTIPNSFNHLKKLRYCDLTGSYSDLTGAYNSIGARNTISGSLPDITGMDLLSGLILSCNYIEGSIPEHYAECPNLILSAQYNCLSGVLSDKIIHSTNFANWSITPQREGYGFSTNSFYESTDYSRDGNVVTIQKASRGKGIDVVIMGDAFADYEIADGTYDKTMRRGIEHFFALEPYASYRDCFNIYEVEVVSKNNVYLGKIQETALGTYFGEGTYVAGDNLRCENYALRAIGHANDDTLIIVILNREYYAGTCNMYHVLSHDEAGVDYGNGYAIAYLPLGTDDEMFRSLIQHEAAGHGFAKLADEYFYDSGGYFNKEWYDSVIGLNWYPNIDYTCDPGEIKWKAFLGDHRYLDEGVGIFEGGATLPRGIWRPTENSVMRDNTGEFNAPSREAIWKRINKLSYGTEWEFRHEDFVNYDRNVREKACRPNRSSRISPSQSKKYPPLNPPVVYTVKEAFQRGKQNRGINNQIKKKGASDDTTEYSFVIGDTRYLVKGNKIGNALILTEPKNRTNQYSQDE